MTTKLPTTHPSYGTISLSRWHCGGRGRRLFGSKLPGHNTGMTIRITEASMSFDLGSEQVTSVGGRQLVEVHLSAVQWAELLTTVGAYNGVPCTVDAALGDRERRGEPPAVDSEPERVRAEVADKLQDRVTQLRATRAALADKIRGKVPVKLEKEINDALAGVEQDLAQNIPWYSTMFTEATDRIVVCAKAELDAFWTHAAQRLGVKAIELGGIRALLTDGDTE